MEPRKCITKIPIHKTPIPIEEYKDQELWEEESRLSLKVDNDTRRVIGLEQEIKLIGYQLPIDMKHLAKIRKEIKSRGGKV